MVAFATQVKRRRGTTAQNDAFTGAEGEIVVDTEKHELRVHDGVTRGGHIIPTTETLDFASKSLDNLSAEGEARFTNKANSDLSNIPSNIDYVIESQEPTAENGYTWYRKHKSGWVEQGGRIAARTTTVTLPVEMSVSEYSVFISYVENADETTVIVSRISTTSQNTTQFSTASSGVIRVWQLSGMAAQ